MKPLCIYHGNCADGFGAAWVVREFFGKNVDFHPGVYQDAPPDCAGRDVILVDFSYKRAVLESLLQSGDIKQASTILILDHHKSAAEDLSGIQFPERYGTTNAYEPYTWRSQWEGAMAWPVRGIFDMDRSGAGLAWDFFFPLRKRPRLIDHIEDRDLWRFALPHTREIQATVFSHPYDFAAWDDLMASEMSALATEGTAIERKHHKDVAELVKVCKRRLSIGGHTVWAASLPYTLTSDAGHLMAEGGEPFAACYWDTPEGRVFSLRSREGGADVSEIAKQYGGGGHKNASGFRVPLANIAQFEISHEARTERDGAT